MITRFSPLVPVLFSSALVALTAVPTMAQPVLEIRVYTLKPGVRDAGGPSMAPSGGAPFEARS